MSQGLDQLADRANQREMMEAQMMRAENLAALRNYYTTHRELTVTKARGQTLIDLSDHRTTAEHAARDEEIDRENKGHASNEAATQSRQLSNAEHLQDSGFVNQNELRGRVDRVQLYRANMVRSAQIAKQITALQAQMQKYKTANTMNAGFENADESTWNKDPTYHGMAGQYTALKMQQDSLQKQMNDDPYVIPGVGDGSGSTPTRPSVPSYLMQQPAGQGAGMADQPYPQDSGGDESYMSSPDDGDDDQAAGDDGTGAQ
ncbi:MAG: hypothetical protein ACRDRL_11540 [Sciscionella sp.]